MKDAGNFIQNFYYNQAPHVMIDRNHNSLIYSTAICSKPKEILELGIGSGFITYVLLYAIQYNCIGKITSVDNWSDWGSKPPEIQNLINYGVCVIESEEETFVRNAKKGFYDLIVVDGNHNDGHKWASETLDLLSPGGVLFAHDIILFPNLGIYKKLAEERNLSYKIYSTSTRKDERCDRGFIVIYNE